MNLKSKVKLAARAISNSLSSEDQGVEFFLYYQAGGISIQRYALMYVLRGED